MFRGLLLDLVRRRRKANSQPLQFDMVTMGAEASTVGRGDDASADTRHASPVSGIRGLAHLLPLGELLRLWEPQKWILRTIWGL